MLSRKPTRSAKWDKHSHVDFISVSPNFKDNDKVIFNSRILSQTSHQLINISWHENTVFFNSSNARLSWAPSPKSLIKAICTTIVSSLGLISGRVSISRSCLIVHDSSYSTWMIHRIGQPNEDEPNPIFLRCIADFKALTRIPIWWNVSWGLWALLQILISGESADTETTHTHTHTLQDTLPETNVAPENGPSQKETSVFQPSILRGYVSFREGTNRSILRS